MEETAWESLDEEEHSVPKDREKGCVRNPEDWDGETHREETARGKAGEGRKGFGIYP